MRDSRTKGRKEGGTGLGVRVGVYGAWVGGVGMVLMCVWGVGWGGGRARWGWGGFRVRDWIGGAGWGGRKGSGGMGVLCLGGVGVGRCEEITKVPA